MWIYQFKGPDHDARLYSKQALGMGLGCFFKPIYILQACKFTQFELIRAEPTRKFWARVQPIPCLSRALAKPDHPMAELGLFFHTHTWPMGQPLHWILGLGRARPTLFNHSVELWKAGNGLCPTMQITSQEMTHLLYG